MAGSVGRRKRWEPDGPIVGKPGFGALAAVRWASGPGQYGLKSQDPDYRIKAMARVLVNLSMVWFLAGPPALCRGGMLVQCCEHEPAESSAVASRSSCCDKDHSGGTERQPTSPQAPRKCGNCVTVCFGVTKPSDDSIDPILVGWAFLPLFVGQDSTPPRCTIRNFERPMFPHKLPFPPSDVPLLI